MIYICTHTDFEEYKKNGDYTIISSNELNNEYSFPVINADNELSDMQFGYAEGYMIYDIWKKHSLNQEWIGINHYRRYFDSPDDKTTIPAPILTNMHRQYAGCHNIEDLLKVESIIDRYYPDYHMDYANINVLYPCNMFIMRREDFNAYCEFVFGVLGKFNEDNNLHSDEDVLKYVTSNADKYSNRDLKYQSRLQGFLMERIGTIFFLKHFKVTDVDNNPIHVVANKKRLY